MSLVGIVLSGRGFWDGLITRPEKSQCDLETSTEALAYRDCLAMKKKIL